MQLTGVRGRRVFVGFVFECVQPGPAHHVHLLPARGFVVVVFRTGRSGVGGARGHGRQVGALAHPAVDAEKPCICNGWRQSTTLYMKHKSKYNIGRTAGGQRGDAVGAVVLGDYLHRIEPGLEVEVDCAFEAHGSRMSSWNDMHMHAYTHTHTYT